MKMPGATLPHARCEAGETCPGYGRSVHCREHPDFGCTRQPELCYAMDDTRTYRCVRVDDD